MDPQVFKALSDDDLERLSLEERLAYTRQSMEELRRHLQKTRKQLDESKKTLDLLRKRAGN